MQAFIYKSLVLLLCTCFIGAHSQNEFNVFTKKDGITSLSVTSTLSDSKGIVWIGTDNGLNAYANSQWYAIKSIEDNKSGNMIPLGKIETIYEDRKRNIWVSSDDGLFMYNGEYWTNFKQKATEESYVVKQFYEDRQGRIWCAEEYHNDLSDIKEFGFNLVSGKLQMYDYIKWYNFDDDLATTASIDQKTKPRFFTAIFQDRPGNMWFGTLDGVYQFEQKGWTKYEKDALKSKKVFSLLDDGKGNKWAATENGVSRFDGDNWQNFNKKDGLTGIFIYDLKKDPFGRLWAFSRNELKFSGLSMYNGEKWIGFDNDDLKIKGFVEELIWMENEIIAFSKDGVSIFRDDLWDRFGKKDGLKESRFSLIKKDRNGNLWLAAENGFYAYNNGIWEIQFQPDQSWAVSVIYIDRYRHIWLGTEKSGVYHFNGYEWLHYAEGEALADDHVYRIFGDKMDNTWVVTKKGISLFEQTPDQ